MADDSLEIQEELDFHSCNVPYGMVPFVFDDITYDQKKQLNQMKVDTIRRVEMYLARHPQVRAIIDIILRRVFRMRPKKDIRTFIARYFLRSYDDIKDEVAEVMRPRKDRVHEGNSAVCLAKPKDKSRKGATSREGLRKERITGVERMKAEELESDEPAVVIRAIVNEILDHLELVCMKDMNIIFSDDEDEILSDFNFRARPSKIPIGKSISEELSRIETEERMAQEAAPQVDKVTDEESIRKYLEEAAYYEEDEFYHEMMYMDEFVGEAGERQYEPAWKYPSRDGGVTEEMSIGYEEYSSKDEKESEIEEVDYEGAKSLDEPVADEATVEVPEMELFADKVAEYKVTASELVSGKEAEGQISEPEMLAGEEERQHRDVDVEELTDHGETIFFAPLVAKDSAEQEKNMEEYFLAPIEDTVPTYLQADDDKQDWTPNVQEVIGTKAKMLPTAPRSQHAVVRSLSITPGEAKGSRVQLVIDRGEVHDHKPQAWDFADKGPSSKTKLVQSHSTSKTRLLSPQEKSKSVTLIRTPSRHDKNRNDPKKFD